MYMPLQRHTTVRNIIDVQTENVHYQPPMGRLKIIKPINDLPNMESQER